MPDNGSNVRVAVITTQGGPLSRAIADALVSRGAHTWLIGGVESSGEAADGPKVASCDLQDVSALRATIQTIDQLEGRIDVLVNSIDHHGPNGVWDIPEEDWDRCIRLNMKSPFFALQACAPIMRRGGGGRVINLSSVLSEATDGEHELVYGLAKAGLNSMTRQWAVDLSPDNIQVNSLWLGTERAGETPSDPQVAAVVAYFALDASSFVNGAQIPVDAGAAALHRGHHFDRTR